MFICACKHCQKDFSSARKKKACPACRSRIWRAKNPESKRLQTRASWHRNKEKYKTHTSKYKLTAYSAAKRGLECTITLEDYTKITSLPCHYCGQHTTSFGRGLDRIDNYKGYTLNNVLPCCGACNRIRNRYLTVEEMEVAMRAVLAFRAARCVA